MMANAAMRFKRLGGNRDDMEMKNVGVGMSRKVISQFTWVPTGVESRKSPIKAAAAAAAGPGRRRAIRSEAKSTMAPPEDQPERVNNESSSVYASSPVDNRPISTIVFVIAMQTEAQPLVTKFQLAEDVDPPFPKGVPWVRYYGNYKDLNINIVCPGKDSALGVDCVGTVSASLITYASIQALKPDLIINAGTAGGFKAKGASIGDVFLVSHAAFHDRRIPIPVFDLYGVGLRQACPTPNLLKELNMKVGKLSTGDSLDMSPTDETSITANEATLKDMEGAAVAYVSDLLKVPAILLKAVTDIVDGDKPTAEEFLQNLLAVTAALDEAATRVVDFISGKSLSDL
ncbi:unnamed protein product [Cuscuta campestris]|uniref:Nucleoside phosphorylase domain-containing protein n=1 Tax=Cuscuta campestris TaxID=132261 RepID=A0A484M2C8_9ASTE|nr:unnamed protein product [Cuscuta campestris]